MDAGGAAHDTHPELVPRRRRPARASLPPRSRRGLNLVALVLVLVCLAGVGMALSTLARQAGRSGHWFYHAQLAHDLADAGLKQALFAMTRYNSASRAAQAGPLAGVMAAVHQGFATGGTASITLFSSGDPSTLPEPLKGVLGDLEADYSPRLEVTLRLLPAAPLWTGLLDGIPAVDGERRGEVVLLARASVKTPVGIPVERTIALQKAYKRVNLVPPLLGRFSLFVQQRTSDDPNTVPMRFDPSTGDATVEGGRWPLLLRSRVAGALVAPGTRRLDRASFIAGLPDPTFLDQQGWVYLGEGASGGSWCLRMAHGHTDAGESPLDWGMRPPACYPFRLDREEDKRFRDRFEAEFSTRYSRVPARAEMPGTQPWYGLFWLHHGFAENYEVIGLDPGLFPVVQSGGSRKPVMEFGPGSTSCLRLFGTPSQASPTLVFGPVDREKMRRSWLAAQVYRAAAGYAMLRPVGRLEFPLYNLKNLPAGSPSRSVMTAAFDGDYERYGTARVRESAIQALHWLLSPDYTGEALTDDPLAANRNIVTPAVSICSGEYKADGTLEAAPGPSAPRTFTSRLLPWLGTLPKGGGIPRDVEERLRSGDLGADEVYVGNLRQGLGAFRKAVESKLTFEVRPTAVAKRYVDGKKLKLPGVVLVDQDGALELGPIDEIVDGGILVSKGPIRIRGSIQRGARPPAKAPEPLTLVALSGNIEVDSSVRTVEAHLVALDGKVSLGGPELTVDGGVSGKELDIQALSRAGKRQVVHSGWTDPTGPLKDEFRVFFGGRDRIAVGGSVSL